MPIWGHTRNIFVLGLPWAKGSYTVIPFPSYCVCECVSVCVLFFLLPFAESQLWLSLVFLGAFCTANVISSLPHTSLSKLILLGSGISLVFCFCSLLSLCVFSVEFSLRVRVVFILSFHSTPTPFLLRENVAVLSLSFFSNPVLQLHQWCLALNIFTSFVFLHFSRLSCSTCI